MPPVSKPVVYPEVKLVVRAEGYPSGPITVEEAKNLIGWREEPPGAGWKDYDLKDRNGNKIRLERNPTNRPLRLNLALRWMSEMIRGKWALNLETIVFDRFGHVRQGQHRLVGFILADQERELDPLKYGSKELTLCTGLGVGVDPSPEVADTYDTGGGRKLGDVIFQRHKFKGSEEDQEKVSKYLAGAIRLVWLRTGGKTVSSAPHFPHSEAMEFLKSHPKLYDAVSDIESINGKDGLLTPLITLPYASALYYLQSTISGVTSEQVKEFWHSLATGEGLTKGSPILTLRQTLTKMGQSGAKERDALVGAVVKAWIAWIEGKTTTPKDLELKQRKDDSGKLITAEYPQMGGLDTTPEPPLVLERGQKKVVYALGSKTLPLSKIKELTGLQSGQITRMILAANRKGKENPDSLESLGIVAVSLEESEEGKKPNTVVKLTPKGLKLLKGKA